jgi:hypothetical protein
VLRPEAVRVTGGLAGNGSPEALPGVVRDAAYRGTGFSYRIELAEIDTHVKAETRGGSGHEVDQAVSVAWDADACWLLPREQDETLAPAPIPAEELGPPSRAAGDDPERPKEESAG